jgi:peptidyl-prolyl cis-trans isomerase C
MAGIQPTDLDLKSYFEANRSQYREPESLDALFFELSADEQAEQVLQGVESMEDFRQLAARRQGGESGQAEAAQAETVTIVRGRPHPQLGDTEPLFEIETGRWTTQPHENAERRFLVLVAAKTPARTPEFEEVRDRVETEYRSRKRQELMEQIFRDLMTRYDVEIQLPPAESEESP